MCYGDQMKHIILHDLYAELEGAAVEFWLTYRGPLKATQRDPRTGSSIKQKHWHLKHAMREQFHWQLKAVWESHPVLLAKRQDESSMICAAKLADEFKIPPWSFVPLVMDRLDVLCGIDIVMLRLDHPGDSVWSGDIDNRVKTIIDALEVPGAHSGYADLPFEGEINPLYCLLENDQLLTSISVETGRLLKAPDGVDPSWADVSIRVRIKPENVTMLNLGL